jgi:hypothetical protein
MQTSNPNPPDADSVSGQPADPGAEQRGISTNTEASDDATGFGSEFQMRRQQAQSRPVEGLTEHLTAHPELNRGQ